MSDKAFQKVIFTISTLTCLEPESLINAGNIRGI